MEKLLYVELRYFNTFPSHHTDGDTIQGDPLPLYSSFWAAQSESVGNREQKKEVHLEGNKKVNNLGRTT